jgi:hypothetical protein
MENRLAGKKINEIVLLNDHDGANSCRDALRHATFRLVEWQGLRETWKDIRIPRKGNIIDGAFTVRDDFESTDMQLGGMRAGLERRRTIRICRGGVVLDYDDPDKPAPVPEDQLLAPVIRIARRHTTAGAHRRAPCTSSTALLQTGFLGRPDKIFVARRVPLSKTHYQARSQEPILGNKFRLKLIS